MSNTLFSRAIWELIGFGFIDARRFGRLEKNCSIYGLSNRWRRLNEDIKKLDEIERLLNKIAANYYCDNENYCHPPFLTKILYTN